ncbi:MULTISPECIES: chemotaxis protein CheB [Sphingosinicellaceae]|uniref:chemotaxis protein CheB n=1 Tax=Sphingosinicellaceae TaxID=2820280 RepID=UPI001C1DD3C7|nr:MULTISPECIES: chemotaxis protein CheB [Polymorphobacter]QYE33441.1 response regulator [Polymorphobacter sp. PAMC 29334]UAJ12807.1 response regulator [Polymorphobacter megasporae]
MSTASSRKSSNALCPIVAIGASAGGLEACRLLLDVLAPDTGCAFIIVQHLDPLHDSLLVELLARHTAMPVDEARHDTSIEPNHVYVIAPGTTLTVANGHLHTGPPETAKGIRQLIDDLLRSLAFGDATHVTAIILSGTGSDGSVGLAALHAAGGRVLAQDPKEANFPGMPQAAIDTGHVDRICRIADMPAALSTPRGSVTTAKPAETAPDDADDTAPAWLTKIVDMLQTSTAHDFHPYKTGTLQRRIERRMGLAGIKLTERARYLDLLRGNEDERTALAKDLLINVTSFFRDATVFDELAQTIIPELVRAQPADRPLRVWTAGCSTGEETYSLAMLFHEAIANDKRGVRLQMFASDVDGDAVTTARAGIYPKTIERDVSRTRLARFFVREDETYRALPELRQTVVFTVQDLLADPPFSRLDMVSCRNLLIYLGRDAQAKVIALLHFSLREGGLLLLGCAETPGEIDGRFELVSKTACLYRHVGRHRPGGFGVQTTHDAARVSSRTGTPTPRRIPLYAEVCRKLVLENYAPAAVLIDARQTVLYSLGPVERYLTVSAGQPSIDIGGLVAPSLRAKLRAAIGRATADNKPVDVTGPRGTADRPGYTIVVRPVVASGEAMSLVCFVDRLANAKQPTLLSAPEATRIAELEHELAATRLELRSALDDLEHAADDQKSVNEEALSVNEEFQSTNEELLTSKEELQSLNEELTALNGQLQETLGSQRTTSNDLQNVLYSTDVATLFLDKELKIRFFTPATRALFHVITGDIGRPLSDLHSFAADAALADDARAVMAGQAAIEREVVTAAGEWCRTVLPYRAQDSSIEGVVITFADITERKRVAAALDSARRTADEANLAKSRFLAAASHDLRQPLQTLALIQGLLANRVDDDRGQHLVARFDETLGAMTGLLNTLLDINQIEAGTLRAQTESLAIGPLLERLRDEFTYHAEAKRLVLRVVGSTQLVTSDPRLLEQILRNLLSNALKYTSNGKVLLGCRRHGEMLRVEVLDTGIGIPEAELGRIFGEYEQLDNSARERSRGLGLGLAIVRRLGDLLGHPVHVRSQLGRGSIFWLEVPIAANAPVRAVTEPLPQPLPEQKALILLVEDDPEIRDLLDMALRDAGHDTLVARDGAAAVLLQTGVRPDLILTDYNLPGDLNGLEMALHLRSLANVATPVIVLTGEISTETLRDVASHDCRQMSKPVKIGKLLEAIAQMLSGKGEPSKLIRKHNLGTVFVVDDDRGVRDSIRDVLEGSDHTVETFASGEKFLSRYTNDTAGCLLLDAYMPGLSGLDLLRRLRADGHALATVIMTGESDVGMAIEAMKAGAIDFLEKPIGAAALVAAVNRALDTDHDDAALARRRASAAEYVARLTPRQHQIMTLVLAGHPSKNIAADLHISQRTVENHRAAIMHKTNTKSLPELARMALSARESLAPSI